MIEYKEAQTFFKCNKGRILALDIGQKKTGIAICDLERIIATPHPNIPTNDRVKFRSEIVMICKKYEIVGILYGLPLNQVGEIGESAEKIIKIVNFLKQIMTIPFFALDERFTTSYATRMLKNCGITRKKREAIDDGIVASLMLEEFLRSYKNIL
jgi:putative Holliday junction resolvase